MTLLHITVIIVRYLQNKKLYPQYVPPSVGRLEYIIAEHLRSYEEKHRDHTSPTTPSYVVRLECKITERL